MKKIFSLFLLLFILSSCTSKEAPGAIYGNVKLIGQSDFSNVVVSINGTNLKTSPEDSGMFMIVDIPKGTYSVTVVKEGYISQTIEGIVILPEQAIIGLDFVLVSLTPPSLPD